MPTIIKAPHHGVTKREAADLCGIRVYDTALPQPWLDGFVDALNKNEAHHGKDNYAAVLSNFVWGYDICQLLGGPVPLTERAYALLLLHDHIFGTHHAEETPRQSYTVLESA